MGLSLSKKDSSKKGSPSQSIGDMFVWEKLESGFKPIRYDPRFEDIAFSATRKELLVSDLGNNIFRWTPVKSSESSFKRMDTVAYEYAGTENVGKHFDLDGTALAWTQQKKDLFYFEIAEDVLYRLDLAVWTKEKYGTDCWVPPKQMITLPGGEVIFMVGRKDPLVRYDLVRMNVKTQAETQRVTIRESFSEESDSLVYWGFNFNPTFSCVSILMRVKKEKATRFHVLLVSLKDGSVLWKFDVSWVHDMRFSANGNHLAVFERSRETQYGFIHVLNVPRLEWVCQARLTYGGFPLGWDGICWCGTDALVFIAPYRIEVMGPGDRERDNESEPFPASEMSAQTKTREIAVLSIRDKWWDLERHVFEAICKQIGGDANSAKLILEYAGLAWAMVQFDHPGFKREEESGDKKKEMRGPLDMIDKGAMSECLESGRLGSVESVNSNYILLARMAQDKATGIWNQWVFHAVKVPASFGEMWEKVKNSSHFVRSGVLGSQNRDIK